MKPHKHAEVIKAFVDGVECEYFQCEKWWDIQYISQFQVFDYVRIKPEPIIRKEYLVRFDNEQGMFYPCQQETSYEQIKLTYKDNILINAEVIK
jgi:hypothetical protein